MEIAYLGIVIFLFCLATIDLIVGVSNDAVNFLSSAVGAKAAPLKRILFIASCGVFLGAASSNGMMEIARHGIFQPEHFFFNELMCIFLAVVISDVILLDIFNSLGLPTSTTVSMVFELLGASFIISLIKLNGNCADLNIADLINTEKALSVIIGIFLSVAIAFFFGTIVQWLTRLLFTFKFDMNSSRLKDNIKVSLFGGIAATSILYFMLIKGMKDASFMTADLKEWMNTNVSIIVFGSFIAFTLLMFLLRLVRINVFKIVVLMGTFALAMAFAGNDLVNFIGVTLAGFSSYVDFTTNGAGVAPDQWRMDSLNDPAGTPIYFLIAAGAIMVFALVTSKKARKVLNTSIGLSRQDEGDEMFGTSSAARSVVRFSQNTIDNVISMVPKSVRKWCDERFQQREHTLEEGAAFDLLRASVNLVLAGLLVAFGTSLKLPLSTTYVTFMVAMGSSLADRAWSRESAVYRVTGVISVIGGWLVTAGAAFLLASIAVSIMYFGGLIAMGCCIVLAAFILIRSHMKYNKKEKIVVDTTIQTILNSDDTEEVWDNLKKHTANTLNHTITFAAKTYKDMFRAFTEEDLKVLRRSLLRIVAEKGEMKKQRRQETKGLQRIAKGVAFEKNAWYHLMSNSGQQILNTLNRICDPMKEHTDNNFSPLSEEHVAEFSPYCQELHHIFLQIASIISSGNYTDAEKVSEDAKFLKKRLSDLRKLQTKRLTEEQGSLKTAFVYLNLIQESHELLSQVRNILRGAEKFFNENSETLPDNSGNKQ